MEYCLLDLDRRLTALERQHRQQARFARVTGYDPAREVVTLDLDGQGTPVEADLLHMAAGAFKVRVTPAAGETMLVLRVAGDGARLLALGGYYNGARPSPSQHGEELVISGGAMRLELRHDSIRLSVGGTSLTLDEAGIAAVAKTLSQQGNTEFSAGHVKSSGKRIDHSHSHGGIKRGKADTDPPN
ncbi:hypothetical protein [Polycladidibacter hongkongensis]|uniref:hypothetical protein n=1 Tax=Polycladidibacter hongkongensis TaxID=1647556 RepID=UPI00082DDDA4|nr:hypothetical protein [Pseudovibrio hongkongensis]